MVLISEFLPNPAGKDADGEWIELFNSGTEPVDLSGWVLKDASGKSFSLDGYRIAPAEYLVLNSKTTKIGLNNGGETLFLYRSGDRKDQAEFSGTAGEGISVSRKIGESGLGGETVFSSSPTPGRENIFDSAPVEEALSPTERAALSEIPVSADVSSAAAVIGGSGMRGIFIFAAAFAVAAAFLAALLIRKIYSRES